jgi:hypothetical protein
MKRAAPIRRFINPEQRTPRYEAAVQALRALAQDDHDLRPWGTLVDRAYAEAVWELRHEKFLAAHPALEPCRPTAGHAELGTDLPLRDHVRTWRVRRDKSPVLVFHPYWDHVVAQGTGDLARVAADRGLTAVVLPHGSWHFPGFTPAVYLAPREAIPSADAHFIVSDQDHPRHGGD